MTTAKQRIVFALAIVGAYEVAGNAYKAGIVATEAVKEYRRNK